MLSDLVYSELSEGAVILDGLDECVVGVGFCSLSLSTVLVYSVERIIDSLVGEDGMDVDEAEEYFGYNIAGLSLGEGSPIFISLKIADGDIVMAEC